MSVPYTPPSRHYIPVEEVALLAPNLGYQADFADLATSSKLDIHLERFLSITFRPPTANENYMARGSLFKLLRVSEEVRGPSILDDFEFQHYVQGLRKGGMHGPLNYYRTAKHRHEEEALADLPSDLPDTLPVLFVWGTKDLTATPFVINKSRKFIQKLQDVAYEGRGHWVLVEVKDEITKRVAKWLQGLTSGRLMGKL
ncbi:hypothetical protein DXG03_000162 [Asterophora parasitica]|uniref:Alpha/beta-hydrolase n=1 Tax=Asterophora parasitica TaxID=117018 RepID=A0A9P7GHR7_9AGAR|nr:hypothetical protein DXG03_000162 [Asterophora parasitica]